MCSEEDLHLAKTLSVRTSDTTRYDQSAEDVPVRDYRLFCNKIKSCAR